MRDQRITLTDAELAAAREWIADCEWRDLDADDIAELSDTVVSRGVARHYCGGLAQFRADYGLVGYLGRGL